MSHVSVVVVGGDNDAIQVMDSSLEVNGNGSGGGLATSSSSPSSSSHGSMEQRYICLHFIQTIYFHVINYIYLFTILINCLFTICIKYLFTFCQLFVYFFTEFVYSQRWRRCPIISCRTRKIFDHGRI